MSDGKVWHFDASLGLMGVPTVDGRVLTDPGDGMGPRTRQLPLPVLGARRVQRRPDADPGDHELEPVGVLRSVSVRGEEIVARGYFGDTVLGRHYAGALAVEAVWLQLAVDEADVHIDTATGGMVMARWRVASVTLANSSAWPVELLYTPRVWQAARPTVSGFEPG